MARSLATFFIIACCTVSVQGARANVKAIVEHELDQVEGELAQANLIQVDGEDILIEDSGPSARWVGDFKCGSLTDSSAACYPRRKKGWTESGTKGACSSQCTLEEGTMSKVAGVVFEGLPPAKHCKCPNKGEKCRSVLDKNPGVESTYVAGITWTGPIKVERATGKWQFLTSEKNESGQRVWKWKSPPRGDLSFLEHSQVITPSDGELKHVVGEKIAGANPDFCDAKLAGQYFHKLSGGWGSFT